MIEVFTYPFFIRSLAAALFASITCGIIGTYIVSKRLVFISGGITHSSFGGIGIGYYIGINPIIGAAIFSVFSAFAIEMISKKEEIRSDSLIGILWSFGMAVGIFFIFITPGYAPNLMSYLFGNILTVSVLNIRMMILLSIIVILFFSFLYKEILFIAFDEEYARAQGLPVNIINYIILTLIALTVVINIRIVGIILVISLLTIPQATAGLFTKNFKKIIFYSIFLGFCSSVTGLFVSYYINIPSGASIIFSSICIFLVLRLIKTIAQYLKLSKIVE